MNRYKNARSMGYSHEGAILFESRDIVDEDLKHPREKMGPAEIHTVVANARLPYLLPLIPELEAALSSHKQGNYVLLRTEA